MAFAGFIAMFMFAFSYHPSARLSSMFFLLLSSTGRTSVGSSKAQEELEKKERKWERRTGSVVT